MTCEGKRTIACGGKCTALQIQARGASQAFRTSVIHKDHTYWLLHEEAWVHFAFKYMWVRSLPGTLELEGVRGGRWEGLEP